MERRRVTSGRRYGPDGSYSDWYVDGWGKTRISGGAHMGPNGSISHWETYDPELEALLHEEYTREERERKAGEEREKETERLNRLFTPPLMVTVRDSGLEKEVRQLRREVGELRQQLHGRRETSFIGYEQNQQPPYAPVWDYRQDSERVKRPAIKFPVIAPLGRLPSWTVPKEDKQEPMRAINVWRGGKQYTVSVPVPTLEDRVPNDDFGGEEEVQMRPARRGSHRRARRPHFETLEELGARQARQREDKSSDLTTMAVALTGSLILIGMQLYASGYPLFG